MLTKILLLSLLAIVSAEKVRYDNYAVYKVTPQNEEGFKYLKGLYRTPGDLTFWAAPSRVGEHVSVLTPPEKRTDFEESLTTKNVEFEVTTENIQE